MSAVPVTIRRTVELRSTAIEPTSTPPIIGTSRNPDDVAETPRTTCRTRSRTRASDHHQCNSTPMTMATEKMSFLNRRKGSSGSRARRS